jgi:hypothetical protein
VTAGLAGIILLGVCHVRPFRRVVLVIVAAAANGSGSERRRSERALKRLAGLAANDGVDSAAQAVGGVADVDMTVRGWWAHARRSGRALAGGRIARRGPSER